MRDSHAAYFHMVGIGGLGMAPLARLLIEAGHQVSGSDSRESPVLQELRDLGVCVTVGHTADVVVDADIVVSSPAIPWRNIELSTARLSGVPVRMRAEVLADLLKGRHSICVAGSHGKTTTTAMLAAILDRGGKQPGFIVGGIAPALAGVTARLGHGEDFVVEACEAFRALDHWQPHHCLITNIDDKHSHHYGGHDRLRAAFVAMLERVPAEGIVALCGDDYGAVTLGAQITRRVMTYGLGDGNTLQADQIQATERVSNFRVLVGGKPCGRVQLSVPGRHNLCNALGALAIALEMNIPFATASEALQAFTGIQQHWEKIGEACGIRVFHDCAHHPTQIDATLAIARDTVVGDGRLFVVVRSQTHSCATDFATALSAADQLLLLPGYRTDEVTATINDDARLAEALQALDIPCRRLPDTDALPALVTDHLRRGDVLVTLGADDLGAVGRQVLTELRAPRRLAKPDGAGRLGQPPALLHGFFERRVAIAPGAPCIEDGNLVWHYDEINTYANQVARHLIHRGVGPETLVALHLDKSMRMLALVLGVLKAGAAYIPIDPRLERDTQHGLIERNPAVRCIISDGGWRGDAGCLLHLDTIWPDIRNEDPSPVSCDAGPANLAYAMFTSGSTGTPKLVGVEHRNVVNLLAYATTTLLDAADLRVVPFIDSHSFDSSVHQIFTTLTHGGLLLVERDLARLLRSPNRDRITSLGTTPAVLRRMLESAELPPSVRVVGLGGDVIPEALIEDLRKLGTVRKALNYYGPTETTIYSTVAWLIDPRVPGHALRKEAAAGRILGRPIANTRIYIVNQAGQIAAPGNIGEICIGGAGVARGYLGAPALTAERFGPDPFNPDPSARWYRTGDRGRVMPDGRIEFVGRIDNQFKLNGVRIDAAEIEVQLASCPGIRQAAVALQAMDGGQPQLVAFAVADPGVDLVGLRAFLRRRLPPMMIPTRLNLLEQMPITPNGKLDRAALTGIAIPPATLDRATSPPRNGTEARLLAIWQEVLQHDEIGIDDDFFTLGGDSLSSVRIIMMTEAAFATRLDAEAFAETTTIATLAQQVSRVAGRVPPAASDSGARISLLRKQWMHVAAWKGQRQSPGSLIVTRNPTGRHQGLFWCLQGFEELCALAAVLGEDQPVHGMRSGHLVMRYTAETLDILAHCYAEEIMALQPEGTLRIGGNCQGGTVARVVAMKLQAQGRRIDVLFQMELNTFRASPGHVALIFGRDSIFNPYHGGADPDDAFRRAYPEGYTVDLIDGVHGSYFREPNIQGFSRVLRRYLD
jgi:UDP-N-acetylmuramate--L-alanine ligase